MCSDSVHWTIAPLSFRQMKEIMYYKCRHDSLTSQQNLSLRIYYQYCIYRPQGADTILNMPSSIDGSRNEESSCLLKFLLDHVGRGIAQQAHVRWEPKTVAKTVGVWDRRVTSRSVIAEWIHGECRYLPELHPSCRAMQDSLLTRLRFEHRC